MTVPAYQTGAQAVYWGDEASLTDIGQDVLSAPIQSSLSTVARVVLGSTYPQLRVGRVDYRLTLGSMAASAAQALVSQPEATVAVIQTDAMTALVMEAAVNGLPTTAANAGVITANVPVAPTGPTYRCAASRVTSAGTTAATEGERAFAVVLEGSTGNLVRGSTSKSIAGPGIYDLGTNGTTVTVPANVTAWVLSGPQAKADQ